MTLSLTQPCAVLVGDSITQKAWTGQGLATRLSVRQLDVINRGYSGFTTRDILPIARDQFKQSSNGGGAIQFITLFLGANDACLFGPQHVPVDDYTANLHAILNLFPVSLPKLLITPPIPDGKIWAASKGIPGLEPNRSEENTAKYADAARSVARAQQEKGVELIDFWQAMDEYRAIDGQRLGDLLTDGLHLTELGYKLLSDLVLDHLSQGSAAMKPNNV